jgi:hypothetical protein
MLLGTYIVFPPVSVLGMTAFTQAFLRHTGIVTGADWLPIALISWALVWLLIGGHQFDGAVGDHGGGRLAAADHGADRGHLRAPRHRKRSGPLNLDA